MEKGDLDDLQNLFKNWNHQFYLEICHSGDMEKGDLDDLQNLFKN